MATLQTNAVSGLIYQAASQTILDFQRRELGLQTQVRKLYKTILDDYKSEMDRWFFSYFGSSLNDKKEPSWEFTKAKNLKLFDKIPASFNEAVDSLEIETGKILTEELYDGYDSAYYHELWTLDQGGIDVSEAGFLDETTLKALLLASGVAGVSYLARLAKWSDTYQKKFKPWFRSAVAGNLSAGDTSIGFGSISDNLEKSVTGLAANELRRSFLQGQLAAREQYEDEIKGEVWITREDPLVCEICRPLHLQITYLQPITDSHPNCRCTKVPIPLNKVTGSPLDYVAFLQQIGRR